MDVSAAVPFLSTYGKFTLQSFEVSPGVVHLAMWLDDLSEGPPPLVRFQSSCTTGTALQGEICDCRLQLDMCLKAIASEGRGLAIYFCEEARGHGLQEKLRGMAEMMFRGADTVDAYESRGLPADKREYLDVAPIFKELGIMSSVRLMTNNPNKVAAVEALGFTVERVPVEIEPTPAIERYLATKKHKLGHVISTVE